MLNLDKVATFELMLWRLCRGNALLKTADLEEPIEDPQTVRIHIIIFNINANAYLSFEIIEENYGNQIGFYYLFPR